MASIAPKPNWDRLYETASAQDGYFTTRQAQAAGYSLPLLFKYVKNGRVRRARRGVYRLVHFPAAEREELAILWLWSEQEGVFSHQTALALHGLSDVLPNKAHLTLPTEWQRRRLRVPHQIVLHHGDVGRDERIWIGAIPVTSAKRTLSDCAHASLSPELLRQAARQALQRGLVVKKDLRDVVRALAPFGGLAA